MQLLLDTQAFLWWVEDSPRLSRRARRAIAEPGNDCWLSLVSCWEMAIKVSLGRLRLRSPLERFVSEQLGANGFRLLEVDLGDVSRIVELPFHHLDPFDPCSSRRPLVESCGSSKKGRSPSTPEYREAAWLRDLCRRRGLSRHGDQRHADRQSPAALEKERHETIVERQLDRWEGRPLEKCGCSRTSRRRRAGSTSSLRLRSRRGGAYRRARTARSGGNGRPRRATSRPRQIKQIGIHRVNAYRVRALQSAPPRFRSAAVARLSSTIGFSN
jgi:PIN domain nuclease of toxin-antitoxin system